MSGRLLAGVLTACAVACAPATTAAQDPSDPGTAQTFGYGSAPLDYPYIVYTPTTYAAHRPAPLVVMVHGCQTTAEQQMRANLYNRLAEREGFIVLYPDVDVSATLQPGPTVRCWRFFEPGSWFRDQGDAAAIAGMTRTVMRRWSIDPERVYMMGMSAGSFMTSIMAAAYPDLYAAVGLDAGGAYADGTCLLGNPATVPVAVSAQLAFDEMGPRARVIPRLVIGGDKDGAVPPACADKALEQGLRTDNLIVDGNQEGPISLTPAAVRGEQKPGGYAYTVKTYRDPAGCVIAERWLVHGMDHFWSGGSSDSRWAQWTDPKGPSAADVSWAFLSRYRKSQTGMPCAEATPPQAAGAVAPASAGRARTCPARRVSVHLELRRGERVRAVRAWVGRRRVRARIRGRRVEPVLPGGRAAHVRLVIRARLRGGRTLVVRRVYERCAAR